MDIILDIVKSLPWFGDLLMLMGVLRLVFKPLFNILGSVVDATDSKVDDQYLAGLKASKGYAVVLWALDFFASVKISR